MTLTEAEDFIFQVHRSREIGLAHIAVTLAVIRRDRLFIEVSPSWKGYIKQERSGISYKESLRLANIGEKYLTFRPQLEENGIKLSENMSKMDLFDPEIAARDPVFFDKFKTLSCRQLREYIKEYKSASHRYDWDYENNVNVTGKGASLYIGSEKVRGINLNEIRREAGKGKRAVVIWVDDDNEARRIKRRMDK